MRKKMTNAKEEWIKEKLMEIDKEVIPKSSKKAYSTHKTLTKTSQHKASYIADTEYGSAIYNPIEQDPRLLQNNPKPEGNDESPSILKADVKEVVYVIRQLLLGVMINKKYL
ncbi:hypothetical protein DPMN_133417 [Dreissena polymorpha]|uniref:Uncharacterized protein n=1 Tax=Dreissena polymorpha TaxID=45954 RepID=A0A9D4FU84_DREPO|nr:hypothetical protein DPMN_133417 [Dreissena polymorpha]